MSMKNRTTNQNITTLAKNQVFVFGSNLSGIHGKGAAKTAVKWGAKRGQGVGIMGKTYGIPTKGISVMNTLRLDTIAPFVTEFIDWAMYHTANVFLVTEIGCGLAGYTPADIAPLFKEAYYIPNIHLPASFWKILNKN